MIISSETEMLEFGKKLATELNPPVVIELVGDVGAGKTTITRGIAKGLGILEPVTSPSFTISKRYETKDRKILTHYDFYRLQDPGLMSEDFSESVNDKNTITIVEWADTIKNFLPENRITINIKLLDDGSREVEIKK